MFGCQFGVVFFYCYVYQLLFDSSIVDIVATAIVATVSTSTYGLY